MLTPMYVNVGLSGLTLVLIGVIYRTTHNRLDAVENRTSGMSRKLDVKMEKETCEDHREHQTKINIEVIERLAKIETKIDILLNGGSRNA